jgi:hypothetical protein
MNRPQVSDFLAKNIDLIYFSEVLDYLESLADSKPEKIPVPTEYSAKVPANTVSKVQQNKNAKSDSANRNPKPSILKRKRPKIEHTNADREAQEQIDPQIVEDDEFQSNNTANVSDHEFEHQDDQRPVKLTLVQNQIADAVGLKPGQTVIIRRRILKK